MTTILITEDEQVVAQDLKMTLEGFGYTVAGIAHSGEQAIALAGQVHPDLIMMDIFLAGEMTGIQAAEEIRSRFDIPIIFLTAYSEAQLIEQVRETGPYGYLLKPFNEQEMYIAIEIALFRHSMDRALRESEQRYRLFVEHFQGVAFRLSIDLVPVFYHGALSHITGYTEEEIILGKPSWETLVHPTDRKAYHLEMENARTTPGYTSEFQFRIIHQQGTIRWIRAFIQNVVDKRNEPLFIQGAFYDVTSTVEAEERLRALNEHLDDLVKKRTLDLEVTNRELFLKNRALQITTASTRALVVAQSEQDLLQIISRILSVSGGYQALWMVTLGDTADIQAQAAYGETCFNPMGPHTADDLPPCMQQVLDQDGVIVRGKDEEACSRCGFRNEGTGEHILATRLHSGTRLLGGVYAVLPGGLMPDPAEITLFQQMAQEISFVIGYLRGGEREKVALEQITRILEQLATLNDLIRNPLQGIVGYVSLLDDPSCEKVIDLCMQVNEIVDKLDQGYLESKKVRSYLERHEHVSRKHAKERKFLRTRKSAVAPSTGKNHEQPW
ncbi:MAG: two-component response regulator [Methanoregulaceae archaeon PtaU1.Bin059]|nr:MAG: two-component response regulator [Methanoregulaceae archaeon PtaB.Bin152]OPY38629.1 MAG: two-component response regulator [Methanoregulaceae archaeon PtaU1.Bin059]